MAVEILEAGLRAADPYAATHRLVRREGDRLSVGQLTLDLGEYERVFVFGAGKASGGIARALEDLLADRISGGLISLKAGDPTKLQHVRVIHAAHPVPDENSLRAGREMKDLAADFGERDLVFGAITGGSSALLCLPAEGISLADKQRVNELLLLSGADIFQINAVRKHLSGIKGGWLADAVLPATLINLTVSDVIGDRLDYITGPTVPDSSTFEDARAVLDEYQLWDRFPPAAADHIRRGTADQETPKEFLDMPLFTFLIVPGDAAVRAAGEFAAELGFRAKILTTQLEGEAKAAGLFFAAVAREIAMYERPFESPCALLAGGENVVTIRENPAGRGGPNQEFALAAATRLTGVDELVVASIDTDGTDGPTGAAGAIVDAASIPTARGADLNISRSLRSHDSHTLLSAIGDVVMTGPTGTNVNDLKLALIGTPRV
jgi:hydroxypyruvate reductase/glycerate 2-kinase